MYNSRLPFQALLFQALLFHLGGAFGSNQSGTMEFSMYAIIKTGGKQYRVENGLKLKIEQVPADVGSELVIDQVLMIADGDNVSMGKPLLSGASVKATVLEQGRHDKVRIFKMRRRKHYQKHQGHRQNYTQIQITGISA
jgi:large subunit ribosomal protein L21